MPNIAFLETTAAEHLVHNGREGLICREGIPMAAPPLMFTDTRHGDRFLQLMDDPDERLRLYVYRWENNSRITPAIYIGRPFPTIFEYLRDTHDGGKFNVMVRRGETMLDSELVLICPSPDRREVFEAYKAKYGW